MQSIATAYGLSTATISRVVHRKTWAHVSQDDLPYEVAPSRKPKVTPEQVLEIRRRRATGASLRALAADYGVSVAHISGICTGKRRQSAP